MNTEKPIIKKYPNTVSINELERKNSTKTDCPKMQKIINEIVELTQGA